MKALFADTQYFIAFLNPDDSHHLKAKEMTADYRGPVVTTEWVLAEVGNAMRDPHHRQNFVRLCAIQYSMRSVTIVPATSELFRKGLQLYATRTDKAWSLIDCTSFVVMEERESREALTADHHFEQAGFVALLK